VRKAAEEKVAGQQVTIAAEQPQAQIIDLFEALKQSLREAEGKRAIGTAGAEPEQPAAAPEKHGGAPRAPKKRKLRALRWPSQLEDLPVIDVGERAGQHTGNPQVLETRLFMQLLVFNCAPPLDPREALERAAAGPVRERAPAVLYEDVHAPRGIGVLSFSEDPGHFVNHVRPALLSAGDGLSLRPEYTMLGRTYATGYEPDLRYWLLERPVATACDPRWPWAIWYPLRRSGAFARPPSGEQAAVLKEHGLIGRAYGAQDLAHDFRLACHGLDARDNEFVIGLIGKDLHPLSHVVQAMRKTRQTSEFIAQMGPFFVGRVARRV
jgi:hypothetical protein